MTFINALRATAAAAILAVATINTAAADDLARWVYINNVSDEFAIEAVYVSHVDDNYWGPNLIAGYDLLPGDYTEVEPIVDQGYCRFDVLLVLDDGYEQVLQGVNLCEATDIYTDGYDTHVQYI